MDRLIEFFEGDNGRLSMSRLLMLGAFLVTSILLLAMPHDKMSEGYFTMYLAAFTGTYLTGKAIDNKLLASTTVLPGSKKQGKT